MAKNLWREMSLKEAGVRLIDCVHQTPPAAKHGYPYIAIPQLKSGRLELCEARMITREHLEQWTRKAKPEAHDVIVSRRCNPGETAYVPPGFEGALGQNLVLLRADGRTVFPPFLRWLTRGPAWWQQVDKFINVGAVFDSLRCADIPGFTLPVPPLPVQRAISALLGALDDKIELNRRMNETLEEMARALFKSWFVDFDPVHAKAADKKPFGMDETTASMFPCKLTGLESDACPEGWRMGAVLDAVELISGGTPKTSEPEYWDGDVLWASAKDVSNAGQAFLLNTERTITRLGVQRSAAKIVNAFSTVVVARGATTGRLTMLGSEMAINQTCYALLSRCGAPFFVNSLMHRIVRSLLHAAHGSVFDTITTATFARSSVLLPPETLMKCFDAAVSPWMARLLGNLQQIAALGQLRDTLLPKLLSGELRIKDAERIVGAAT